ncbi:MAG: hypothetical protein HUJ63_08295, partial [Enterococcus sp.]|nr:hypothetical protein [Enterococcus sp.]
VVDKAKQDSLDMLAQIEFIDQFYKNKWYKKEKKIRAHSSKRMIKQLRKDYDDMYAEGGGLAVWELSTLAQDGGFLVYQGAKKTGENTYVVRLKDNELNCVSIITLTLVKEDGEWKFDSCKIKMK